MRETYILEDLLNNMIELEKTGSRTYLRMAETVTLPEAKEMFLSLSDQELHHLKIYESFLRELDYTQVLDDEYVSYLRIVLHNNFKFFTMELNNPNLESCLKLAIHLEKDTLVYLSEMKTIFGASNPEVIDRMMNEERKHLKLLFEFNNKHTF